MAKKTSKYHFHLQVVLGIILVAVLFGLYTRWWSQRYDEARRIEYHAQGMARQAMMEAESQRARSQALFHMMRIREEEQRAKLATSGEEVPDVSPESTSLTDVTDPESAGP